MLLATLTALLAFGSPGFSARVDNPWFPLRPGTVYVYRADGTVSRLTDTAELNGEGVLPGFVYPIRDLFPAPAPAAP